ncbi:hypothetical protein ASPWEDRAFT_181921 [Aspergillus wentii DTO 134E9]|uniref:GTP-binding protein n=1 Tax=Aspergillus wentii DTO 134E9 TaxID=1073089 RepID=A0A1L9RPV4_ASPWE|nr:uncharacterized protein ASPWEDRAFT_181921 [Aspergillus wentii DTO 134E9]KAI9923881.1 GTP-binding nuclear protein gsp1/Ran [Aspergillus wentii]OJJ36986.1 hypothetical protein ASPWEDRAFT_181921 [Aspergillus wentii DTO 134E9]
MNSRHSQPFQFKLALVGDAGVGKTAFVKRNCTGEFQDEYIPTDEHDVTWKLSFGTNRGVIDFEIWDIAGSQGSTQSLEEYLTNIDAAIIMVDASDERTYGNIEYWHSQIVSLNGDIPIVICGNKADIEIEIKINMHVISRMDRLEYCEISTKTPSADFDEPFLWLCRGLLNDPSLCWHTNCCTGYSDLNIDPETLAEYSRKMEQAAREPIPDETDSDL